MARQRDPREFFSSLLDAQFPFKPPEGAGIPKERLEPFLTASCRTKASADPVQAWIESNGQIRVADQPVYSKEGGALMIAYLKDLTAALPEVKMGPEEFDPDDAPPPPDAPLPPPPPSMSQPSGK